MLPDNCNEVQSLVDAAKIPGKPTRIDLVKSAITEAYCWVLWRHRNDVVFNRKAFNPSIAVNDIQSYVFNWVRIRGRGGSFDWHTWACNPMSLYAT